MKSDKIRVVVKRVGEPAREELVENTLNSYQEIVGGYIEITSNPQLKGIDLICNGEGKLIDDIEPNIHWGDDVIFGNAVFLAHNKSSDYLQRDNEM